MIKEGLERYFKIHGNFQPHTLPSVLLCKLFFFRLSVILSFQLELSALSLGPKAQSVSLCRERVLGPSILTLAPSAGPHGQELIKRPAIGALKWPGGERAESGTERSFKWGSSCEQRLAPFFHSWGFGCMSRVPRVVQHGDLGRLWFTNCFTNISSLWEVWYTLHPPQLTRVTQCLSQTCLCLQLFRKFSQRGRKETSPSSPSVLFLSQHFPQVYLCSSKLSYKVLLYIQMGIAAFL